MKKYIHVSEASFIQSWRNDTKDVTKPLTDFLLYITRYALYMYHLISGLLAAPLSQPVIYVCHKMLLNENESYLVLVAIQILLATINNVY